MIANSIPVIAIIPARKGSKGIPNKNQVIIAGKPLVEYAINSAKGSLFIDKVFVSSDCPKIRSIAENLGVITICRPDEFSTDEASSVDVITHFINELHSRWLEMDPYILYLQPTSPLRTAQHIDEAIQLMLGSNANSVISVMEAEKPPQKAFRLDQDNKLIALIDEKLTNARRQDLPKCYFPNGAIYLFRISAFIAKKGFPSNGSVPYIMSKESSIDVDSPNDVLQIEQLLRGENERI
jgi:CMP-N,N'-diacetyllegionaminic acid synthase